MALSDGDLQMRPYRSADEQALKAIMREPEVSRWWPDPTLVRERGWTVEIAGETAGWVEYHEESYHWYPSVALDIFLGSRVHGRGYGRRALHLAVAHFAARGHHRFTVDPNADNERAIRSYESIGFERVGLMRAYERAAGGGWNDALLMELIVPEGMERTLLSASDARP